MCRFQRSASFVISARCSEDWGGWWGSKHKLNPAGLCLATLAIKTCHIAHSTAAPPPCFALGPPHHTPPLHTATCSSTHYTTPVRAMTRYPKTRVPSHQHTRAQSSFFPGHKFFQNENPMLK